MSRPMTSATTYLISPILGKSDLNEVINTALSTESVDVSINIMNHLYKERHDIFGSWVAKKLNIEDRDDIGAREFVTSLQESEFVELPPESVLDDITKTPDNFVILDDTIYLIDYKVRNSTEVVEETRLKYKEAFKSLEKYLVKKLDVMVTLYNPRTRVVYAYPVNKVILDGPYEFEDVVNTITSGIDMIIEKWQDNEEFQRNLQEEYYITSEPWSRKRHGDLFYTTKEWIEFSDTFITNDDKKYLTMLKMALDENPANSIKDGVASQVIIDGHHQYNDMIKENVEYFKQRVENLDEEFLQQKNPTKETLETAWKDLKAKLDEKFIYKADIGESKPVIHATWAPDNKVVSDIFRYTGRDSNIYKIQKLAGILCSMTGTDSETMILKMLGKSMYMLDDDDCINKYNSHLARVKEDKLNDRKVRRRAIEAKKKDKKLIQDQDRLTISEHINEQGEAKQQVVFKPTETKMQIGNAIIHHNQEFEFNKELQKHKKTLFDLAHIGGYIKFKNMTPSLFKEKNLVNDEFKKIELFDFMDEDLMKEIEDTIQRNEEILKTNTMNEIKRGDLINILKGLKSEEDSIEREYLNKILKTNFYKCTVDISELLRDAMKLSFSRKEKTFRCLVSGSKSTFLILLPSDSIVSRNSSVCYITITIHMRGDLIKTGAEYFTKSLDHVQDGLRVTMSRPMRLDKTRIKRLSNANYLFLLTCMSFLAEKKKNVDDDLLNQIMSFSLYMSMSASKALMSLTEPSRYVMMNSFSLCSDVYGYITDKFDPRCKTWFCAYVANKIKKGSMMAFENRKYLSLKTPKYINDEALIFGVGNEETLSSLWFNAKVTLKQFLMEVYTPFYLNSKDLHAYSSNIIQLMKVPVEIEMAVAKDWNPWGDAVKQKVNLRSYMLSICEYYYRNRIKFASVRNKIERNNNFNKSIFTIDTMTSSKSCIHKGSDRHQEVHLVNPTRENDIFTVEDLKDSINHKNNKRVKIEAKDINMPEYINISSRKVFDVLYERAINDKEYYNREFSKIAFETMDNYEDIVMSMFPKNQRTQTDREIYLGEFDLKMCLYIIERIYKEQSSEDKTEQISKPGDSKLQILQKNRTFDMKKMVEMAAEHQSLDDLETDSTILEINADMSKWSAQDVTYKFIILVCLDPLLFPDEKKSIIKFLIRYTHKKLVFPISGMEVLLNQFQIEELLERDILRKALNDFRLNYIEIGQNWLQGNLNYTSSFVHTINMMYFKDISEEFCSQYNIDCRTTSLVHSDDNQTTCILAYDKGMEIGMNNILINEQSMSRILMYLFKKCCSKFGNQVNSKKTNVNEVIKEFVSFFNLHGEPFSIYSRFLLPAIGDCSYTGPYEDIASRLSSIQSAIRHGCSLELAKIGIAISTVCTNHTYSMMNGQANDPANILNLDNRSQFPIELGGYPNFDIGLFASFGIEAHDISILSDIYNIATNNSFKRNEIFSHYDYDLTKLTKDQIFYLKYIRYINLDVEATVDQTLGESFDMRSRSILTPRLYTTVKVLNSLKSYEDYKFSLRYNPDKLLQEILAKPYLAIGKSENVEEYEIAILYRYFSNRFRESLSIQNSNQLFIEQSLQALEKTIDRECIDFTEIIRVDDDTTDGISLVGRLSIADAIKQLWDLVNEKELTEDDMQIILNHKFRTEPTIETTVNTLNMFEKGKYREKNNKHVVKMTQFATQRNIINSPANILRYYITRDMKQITNKSVTESSLLSDLNILNEFAEQIKLKQKLEVKRQRFNKTDQDKLKTQMFIKTAEMQCLYSFLSQNIIRNRFIVLPANPRNPIDFIKALIGNTRSSEFFYEDNNIKNIVSTDAKGTIAKNKDSSVYQRQLVLKAMCTFISDYIAPLSHRSILDQILNKCYLHGNKLLNIALDIGKQSSVRVDMPGLYFHLGILTDDDIHTLASMSDYIKPTWHARQSDYTLKKGVSKVTVANNESSLYLHTIDDQIQTMELSIPSGKKARYWYLIRLIRALSRENLDISGYHQEEPKKKGLRDLYVWFRYPNKKSVRNIVYTIGTSMEIISKNSDLIRSDGDANLWKYKCKIHIKHFNAASVSPKQIRQLNESLSSPLLFQLGEDRFKSIQRVHKSNMKELECPDGLAINDVDLFKLLTTDVISNDIFRINNLNYYSLSSIFNCQNRSGETFTLDFLDDTPMYEDEYSDVSSHLVPMIQTRTTKMNQNLKSTIKNRVREIVLDFKHNSKVTIDVNNETKELKLKDLEPDSIIEECRIAYEMLTCRIQLLNLMYSRLDQYKEEAKRSKKTSLLRTGGLLSDNSISDIEVDKMYLNMLHHYYKTNDMDFIFHSESNIKSKYFKDIRNLELNHANINKFAKIEIDITGNQMDFNRLFNTTFKKLLELDELTYGIEKIDDFFREWDDDAVEDQDEMVLSFDEEYPEHYD